LQNHGKIKRLNTIRQQFEIGPLPVKVQVPVSQRMLEEYGKDITLCPKCNKGKLILMRITYAWQTSSIFTKRLREIETTAAALNNKASPYRHGRASPDEKTKP